MKWIIASDIHGSQFYCEKLIERYKEEKADRLLLLGDILYHGPRNDLPQGHSPKGVITLLNEMKDEILCVRGNCDCEVDQMVLNFPILADYAIIAEGERMIFATHGHLFNESKLPSLKKGEILLHGHTHVPACKEYEDYIYINPGSVSIPKEGSHHGYIVFENDKFTFKDLDGNIIKEFSLR